MTGVIIAVLGLLLGAASASAAVGSSRGFMTLVNPTSGQHLLVFCENGNAKTMVAIIDDEPTRADTSMGTACSISAFGGYEVEQNIDPRSGAWVIAPEFDGNLQAYVCTAYGAVFANSYAGEPRLSLFTREGSCGPGTTMG